MPRVFESMKRVLMWQNTRDESVVRVWRAEETLRSEYDNHDIWKACQAFAAEHTADEREELFAVIEALGRINAIEIVDRRGDGCLVYPEWP